LAKISDEGANSQLLFVLLEWLVIRFYSESLLLVLQLLLRLNKAKPIEIMAKPRLANIGVRLLFSDELKAPAVIRKSTPDKKYK
jgi:hypothetical protein